MMLCLDCGNSRIKYGLSAATDDRWRCSGSLEHAALASLPGLLAPYPPPQHILCANVAGEAIEAQLRAVLHGFAAQWHSVRSTAQAAGVRNGYQNPGQLGVDRWCALLGARSLQAGNLLVVMAGTATTIDVLDAEGNFRGGLILPGQSLMRQALARDTAALPLAEGACERWPQTTADAIHTGTLFAQLGAIERVWVAWPDSICLLSGGASPLLAPHLTCPTRQIADLPLLGLRQLARQELNISRKPWKSSPPPN